VLKKCAAPGSKIPLTIAQNTYSGFYTNDSAKEAKQSNDNPENQIQK